MADLTPPADPNADAPKLEGATPTDLAAPATPAAPAKAAAPRRRRRWPFVVGGLLLLVLLLVVFLPTIASMGWARSIVVAQVNKSLNGRVEVASWSLGWTGGLRVEGVKVFDAADSLVVELPLLTSELSLLDAIQGKYDLGKTVVKGANVNVHLYADGTNTFGRLVKDTGQPKKSSDTLPHFSADAQLVDCRGTVDQEAKPGQKAHTVQLVSINGAAKVTETNAPIENQLTVVARADGGPPGTLDVKGTVGVIRDNKVALDGATVDETVTLQNLDAGAAQAALTPGGAIDTVGGVVDAIVRVQLARDGKAIITPNLAAKNLVLGGKAFEGGEQFRADALTLAVSAITIDMAAGMEHWQAWPIAIGDGKGQDLTITATRGGAALADVRLGGSFRPQALLNLAANLPPASAGALRLAVHGDLGRLAGQMPKTLAVQDGVTLTSGSLDYKADVTLAPQQADLSTTADLANVKGRNEKEKRDLALDPIHLAVKGTTLGGGMKVPELRDLVLQLTGPGLSADVQGKTLAEQGGEVRADLQPLMDQLRQFVDLGNRQVKGQVVAAINSTGNALNIAATGPAVAAAAPGAKPALSIVITARDIDARGVTAQPIAVRYARIEAGAQLVRNAKDAGTIDGLTDAKLVVRVGDEQNPLVAVDGSAAAVNFIRPAPPADQSAKAAPTVVVIPAFALTRVAVTDLARVQAEFGGLVTALNDFQIRSGAVALNGSGGYDGKTWTYKLHAQPERLTVAKSPTTMPAAPGAPPVPLAAPFLSDYTLTADVEGTYGDDAAGGSRAEVSKLALADNKNWLTAANAGNLVAVMPTTGPSRVAGRLKIGAAVAPLMDVYQAYSGTPAQLAIEPAPAAGAAGQPMVIRDGRLDGTVELSSAAKTGQGIAADLALTNLTMGRGRQAAPALQNESLRLVLRASTDADQTSLTVQQMDATGSFLTAQMPTAVVVLKTGPGRDAKAPPALQMVRQLKLTVNVTDLAKLQAVYDALFPAAPAVAGGAVAAGTHEPPLEFMLAQAAPAGRALGALPVKPAAPPAAAAKPPAPPAKLSKGTATINLDVTNDNGRLTVTPQVAAHGVEIAVGTLRHALGDVTLNTRALITPNAPAAAGQDQSIAEQIREVQVPELTANAIGSRVWLKEPLVLRDLAGLSAMMAKPQTQPSGVVATAAPATVPAARAPVALNVAVAGAGDLAPIMALLDVLGGTAAKPTYGGTYTLDEKLATADGKTIQANGGAVVQDFVTLDERGAESFREKTVRLVNNVTADASGATTNVSIGKLSLAMESSGALAVEVAGAVNDLSARRELKDVTADVTYDLAALWKIVHPLMVTPGQPDKYADLQVTGKFTRQFVLNGAYPAGDAPSYQKIASLSGRGSLAIGSFAKSGVTIPKQFDVPVTLTGGVVTIEDSTKPVGERVPPPIECNGGLVRLGDPAKPDQPIRIDLTGPHPDISSPAFVLLDKLNLNAVLTDAAGGFINNPLMVDPKEASGILTVSVREMNHLPLDSFVNTYDRANDGNAKLDVTVQGIHLGNELTYKVADALSRFNLGNNTAVQLLRSLQGDIKSYSVSIHNGVTSHDMTLTLAEHDWPLRLYGDVRMDNTQLMPVSVFLGPEILSRLSPELTRLMPKGLELPLWGAVRAPTFDLMAAVQRNAISNFGNLLSGKPEDLIKNIQGIGAKGGLPGLPGLPGLGGATAQPAAGTVPGGPGAAKPPAAAEPEPIGIIGDLLNRDKKKEEKKKEEKKREEKERRDRKQNPNVPPATVPAAVPN